MASAAAPRCCGAGLAGALACGVSAASDAAGQLEAEADGVGVVPAPPAIDFPAEGLDSSHDGERPVWISGRRELLVAQEQRVGECVQLTSVNRGKATTDRKSSRLKAGEQGVSEEDTPTGLRLTLIWKMTLSARQLESSLPGAKTKRSELTKENNGVG